MSAEWWRSYRLRNRERINRQQAARRQRNGRGDRTLERQRENERHRAAYTPTEPLPMLMPRLQRGAVLAFWEDELRLDLAQEAELAKLEGRCPDAAVKAYRSREYAWHRITTCQLIDDINGDEIAS